MPKTHSLDLTFAEHEILTRLVKSALDDLKEKLRAHPDKAEIAGVHLELHERLAIKLGGLSQRHWEA